MRLQLIAVLLALISAASLDAQVARPPLKFTSRPSEIRKLNQLKELRLGDRIRLKELSKLHDEELRSLFPEARGSSLKGRELFDEELQGGSLFPEARGSSLKGRELFDEELQGGSLLPENARGSSVKGYLTFEEGLKIPKGYRGTVLVENPAELRLARAAVAQARAPDALVAIKRSPDFELNVVALEKRPQSINVLHDLPRNPAAAEKIHEKLLLPEQLDEIYVARERLDTILEAKSRIISFDLAESEEIRRDLGNIDIARYAKRLLALSSDEALNVLIGHIDEGGSIRFEDKSVLKLSEIPGGKKVWVFGCDTVKFKLTGNQLDLATGRAISYDDAVAGIEAVASAAETGASLREMAVELQCLPKRKAPASRKGEAPASQLSPSIKRRFENFQGEHTVPEGYAVMLAGPNTIVYSRDDEPDQTMTDNSEHLIPLADSIAALREQLEIAVRRQRSAELAGDEQFLSPLKLTEVTLETEVITGRDEKLGGKLNYWIAGVDASQTKEHGARQKVVIKLVPTEIVDEETGNVKSVTLGTGQGEDIT